MKILIYSHFFYPSIGGVESVSMELAHGLTLRGFQIEIVTSSKENGDKTLPWNIYRNPSFMYQKTLVKSCEAILYNGCSLNLMIWAIFFRKPVVWVHVGYQVSSIDGLGWVDGERAPLKMWDSFLFHLDKRGPSFAIKNGFLALVKRVVAYHVVSQNVAITEWMNQAQPLPRQTVIHNPFQWPTIPIEKPSLEFDFVYVGRLVSEKGVETLLKALNILIKDFGYPAKLLIVGDGNWKNRLLDVVQSSNMLQNIYFVGKKTKEEWPALALKAKIAIVPSDWYEPMGIVALELLYLGLPVIVSEKGGLKECVGDAGICFQNENQTDLAHKMQELLINEKLQLELKSRIPKQLEKYSPEIQIEKFNNLLRSLIK